MSLAQENVDLVKKLPEFLPNNVPQVKDLFAEDFVWRYYNKHFADIHGDYEGVDGLANFFEKLGKLTKNTFNVKLAKAEAFGDELVVVHANPSMELEGQRIETDAAVVWRVLDGKLAEAWDIPAINIVREI